MVRGFTFECLMNIKAFKEVEGIPYIELRYVGGLNTILEFEDDKEMRRFLDEGEHIWKLWFKSLTPWTSHLRLNKRITSIIVYGVPMHAWCEEAFTIIAGKWGEVIIPESCDTDNLNLAFGRIGILTDHPGIISTSTTIIVDGESYRLNVLEDVFESNRLNPMLASIDVTDHFGVEDWDNQWGDVDYGIEDEPQDDVPPELSPENEWYPTVAEAEVVGEANRRHDNEYWEPEKRQIVAEARGGENQDGKEKDVLESGKEVEPQHNPVQPHMESDGGPNSPRLTQGLSHGPDLNEGHLLGHSVLSRSKSLDLNANPNSSTPGISQTWKPRSNDNSPPTSASSASINQVISDHLETSVNFSQEIEATLEIGEKIGFQFGGNKKQAMRLLKRRGVNDVTQ